MLYFWCALAELRQFYPLLAYCGDTGEKEPWLLATNLPEARLARQAYRRRMWIEGMFGDWKGHGFDVEATRLRHVQRLSRLALAVCLFTFGCSL